MWASCSVEFDVDVNIACQPGRLTKGIIAKNVIVGEGISAIGDEAFKWCRWLNSVEILEATTIGAKSFLNFPSLQTIKMDTVTDVLSKSQGSRSSVNVVRATFDAISKLMDAKKVAQARGKTLDELWG